MRTLERTIHFGTLERLEGYMGTVTRLALQKKGLLANLGLFTSYHLVFFEFFMMISYF